MSCMVGDKGLEPSTSRSQTARASQLRQSPVASMIIPESFLNTRGVTLRTLQKYGAAALLFGPIHPGLLRL